VLDVSSLLQKPLDSVADHRQGGGVIVGPSGWADERNLGSGGPSDAGYFWAIGGNQDTIKELGILGCRNGVLDHRSAAERADVFSRDSLAATPGGDDGDFHLVVHMWNRLTRWFQFSDPRQYEQRRAELLRAAPIPVIWLLGKTGSGKSSIIRYLTGATAAEIGSGFRPQTRRTRVYDFPDETAPLIQFLDTRGLGEAEYDHQSDLTELEGRAHLLLVTVRLMDSATQELHQIWQRLRNRNPNLPVLLAVTAVHEAYPGQPHPADDMELGDWPSAAQQALEAQQQRFAGLYDQVVPIDLTQPEDGFQPPDFRGQKLKAALLELFPAAIRQTFYKLEQVNSALGDLQKQRCAPVIMAHSVLAASVAALPLPWLDMPVVLGIQTNLARKLAVIHQQSLDRSNLTQIMGLLGGSVAVQTGLRQGLKFIPYLGMAVNAASAFAITFAAGWTWQWYFSQKRQGHLPTSEEIQQQFRQQLQRGSEIWSESPGRQA